MKALLYKGVGKLEIGDAPEPRIENSTDAVIKVTNAPICAGDFLIRDEPHSPLKPGDIVGHECSGVVEEVGSEVYYLKKGDRVVGSAAFACGKCFYCQHDQEQLCERGGMFGVQVQGCQA